MIPKKCNLALVLGFTLLLSSGGCGRDPNLPKLEPVSGTVTLNGRPLTNASVTFVPTGTTQGSGATGATGPDGKYVLESRGERGVPAGEYRVVVNKLVMPDGSDFPLNSDVPPIESSAREMLPRHYSDEATSTITKTVPEGGGTIDIQLTTEPPRPAQSSKPETVSAEGERQK